MNIFTWKTLRFLIIGGIIAGNIWLLYLVMPSIGCFHLAGYNALTSDISFSLVSLNNGKCTNIFALNNVRMGWSVMQEFWPLILFGAMIGYPIGEIVRWHFSVEDLLEIAKNKEGLMTIDLFIKESKVKNMLKEAMDRTTALPKLQEDIKILRKDLSETKYLADEQKKKYEAALRKTKSIENELLKARAQIRRLKKKQASEKQVDAELWSK